MKKYCSIHGHDTEDNGICYCCVADSAYLEYVHSAEYTDDAIHETD